MRGALLGLSLGFVSALAFAGPVDLKPLYSYSDLKALDDQGAWQELFNHLSDIAPAQRNDAWNGMLQRSALGVLNGVDGDSGWAMADQELRAFPALRKNKPFMARRAEVSLHGLDACLDRGWVPPCAEHALNSVNAAPEGTDFGFTAGKRITAKDPVAAIQVFRHTLAAHHDATMCHDEALARSVNYSLSGPPEDACVPAAKAIASDLCWDQINEAVMTAFLETSSSNFRRNACPFLMTRKDVLSPLSRKQCELLIQTK